MSSSGRAWALLVLVLIAATAACDLGSGARPERSRRPRPSSEATLPTPRPTPRLPRNIQVVDTIAYSGTDSGTHDPVRLPSGTYRAAWSATGVPGQCTFEARIEPLLEGETYRVPSGHAPVGTTIEGGTQLELRDGAYEVLVNAASCRWRLTVARLDPGAGSGR